MALSDDKDIRLKNLDIILKVYKDAKTLGEIIEEKTGRARFAAYISHIKSGRRPLTEKTARELETALELPPGWMDRPQEDPDETNIRHAFLTKEFDFHVTPREATHILKTIGAPEEPVDISACEEATKTVFTQAHKGKTPVTLPRLMQVIYLACTAALRGKPTDEEIIHELLQK